MITTLGRLLLMGVLGGIVVGGAFGAVLYGMVFGYEGAVSGVLLGALFGVLAGMVLGVASQVLNAVLVSVLLVCGVRPHPVAVSVIPVAFAVAASLAAVRPEMGEQPGLTVLSVIVTVLLSVLIAGRTAPWCLRPLHTEWLED